MIIAGLFGSPGILMTPPAYGSFFYTGGTPVVFNTPGFLTVGGTNFQLA